MQPVILSCFWLSQINPSVSIFGSSGMKWKDTNMEEGWSSSIDHFFEVIREENIISQLPPPGFEPRSGASQLVAFTIPTMSLLAQALIIPTFLPSIYWNGITKAEDYMMIE
jgi:hypothetical protein